jgi:IPT/TIG domain
MNEKRQFKHLGARLRAERPSPSSGLISAIVSRVPERVQHHPKASLRLALAAALAVALVTAVTATGAVGVASKQVSHAVVAVKNSVAPTKAPPKKPAKKAPAKPKPAGPDGNGSGGSVYKGKPKIDFFQPKAACVGQQVTIHGKGFRFATAVTIDGISADFVVNNDRIIRAWVPAGFDGGRIKVFTTKGVATSDHSLKWKFPGCTRT